MVDESSIGSMRCEARLEKVVPPSLDSTVSPTTPTATAFVPLENATDHMLKREAEMSDPVNQPSLVCTSAVPPDAIRELLTSLHAIRKSVDGAPGGSASGSACHVLPSSVLSRRV